MNRSSLFKTAAALALVNAIVHFAGAAMSGFGNAAMPTIVGGIVWIAFAVGLYMRQRWLAYFAFLFAMIAAIVVYATLGSNESIPYWSLVAAIVLDALLAIVLFVLIWRRSERLL